MKYTDEEIIAWLEGTLDEQRRAGFETWLAETTEGRQRVAEFQQLENEFAAAEMLEPPEELLYAFRERIAEERLTATEPQYWYKAAAAVLLVVAGFFMGQAGDPQPAPEFASLQQEVQVLQQMVMMKTLKENSASERLQVINQIEATPSIADQALVDTLVQTLNHDDSPNVRFAAVQALARYTQQELVRQELVRSLSVQEDPLVQIALITTLIEAQEKSAIAPISKIAANETVPAELRQTARLALDILI